MKTAFFIQIFGLRFTIYHWGVSLRAGLSASSPRHLRFLWAIRYYPSRTFLYMSGIYCYVLFHR